MVFWKVRFSFSRIIPCRKFCPYRFIYGLLEVWIGFSVLLEHG